MKTTVVAVSKKVAEMLRWSTLSFVHRRRNAGPLVRIGSAYGGWWVPAASVRPGWIAYCAGVGEDATFDSSLSEAGLQVWSFDPTPRAIAHAQDRQLKVNFVPIGWWEKKGHLKFYSPQDPDHVSHSALNLQGSETYFEAEVDTVEGIAEWLDHSRVDIIKMDIEGAELKVLTSILASRIRPTVLCIEFDSPISTFEAHKLFSRLRETFGYTVAKVEGRNVTFYNERLFRERVQNA